MSLQFPDRSKWLALRSLQPSAPRLLWDRGTFTSERNEEKRDAGKGWERNEWGCKRKTWRRTQVLANRRLRQIGAPHASPL